MRPPFKQNRTASSAQLIYGIHPITEALRGGKNIDKILLKKGLRNPAIEEIIGICRKRHIPIQEVPAEKLQRTTSGAHQGIIAYLSLVTYHDLEDVVPFIYEKGETPFFLVLDRITDVRNFGALCRTALCAGVHAIIFPSKGSAQINEDAIKTSAGAIGNITLCRVHNLKNGLHYLKETGVQVLAITEKATELYTEADVKTPVALMLGSEEDGISPEYMKYADAQLRIPITGPVSSLNVSVAAAVVMFEVVRQRS